MDSGMKLRTKMIGIPVGAVVTNPTEFAAEPNKVIAHTRLPCQIAAHRPCAEFWSSTRLQVLRPEKSGEYSPILAASLD